MARGVAKKLFPWIYLGKGKSISIFLIALILFGIWQLTPVQSIQSLANLTDPEKLATLGERGANNRMNKIMFWLDDARGKGVSAETAIAWAQWLNGTTEPRASLVKESLLRNLKIGDELLLFTLPNRERMRRGNSATVYRGPYKGETIEIDHIIPYSVAPEIGNELANLEMLPKSVNRQKSDRVTSRQLSLAQKLLDAGLLSRESFERVTAAATAAPINAGR